MWDNKIIKMKQWQRRVAARYKLIPCCHTPLSFIYHDEKICWFYQQGGAGTYTDNNSIAALHSSVRNWIIICPLLPTRLPKPPSRVYYLWARMEANEHTPIYIERPKCKKIIRQSASKISGQELQTVFSNLFTWCQAWVLVTGVIWNTYINTRSVTQLFKLWNVPYHLQNLSNFMAANTDSKPFGYDSEQWGIWDRSLKTLRFRT
jgi:hypothetical protein